MTPQERAKDIIKTFSELTNIEPYFIEPTRSALYLCGMMLDNLTRLEARCQYDNAMRLVIKTDIKYWNTVKEIIENK